MKSFLSGIGVIVLALSGAAFAADIPVKAPPAAVVADHWTGPYIGLHVGAAWAAKDESVANVVPPFAVVFPRDLPFNTGGRSAIGGGQIGYNWQVVPHWVVGVEGDFSWTDVDGSTTYNPVPAGPGGSFIPPSSMTMSRDVKWTASLRGRLGFAWDRLLVYGTGGAAWTHADFLGTDSRSTLIPADVASFSATKSGWVVGGGLEYALASNWTIRGEYLYYSTGGVSAVAMPTVGAPFLNFTWDRTKLHVARFALNYRFGDWAKAGLNPQLLPQR